MTIERAGKASERMAAMDDLTAFIAARLDEAMAKAAVPEPWTNSGGPYIGAERSGIIMQARFTEDAAHAARHDPARVLREVAAKRAMVAAHHPELVEVINADQDERSGDFCAGCDEEWPCLTMNAIAAVWSAHPDYRAGWAG